MTTGHNEPVFDAMSNFWYKHSLGRFGMTCGFVATLDIIINAQHQTANLSNCMKRLPRAYILLRFRPWLMSCHLGSPEYVMILFLHVAMFVVLSPPLSYLSYTYLWSFHLRFGRCLLLFPGTGVCMSTSSIHLTMCSSFILLTWPYHLSRFSGIFLDACTKRGAVVQWLGCSLITRPALVQ